MSIQKMCHQMCNRKRLLIFDDIKFTFDDKFLGLHDERLCIENITQPSSEEML